MHCCSRSHLSMARGLGLGLFCVCVGGGGGGGCRYFNNYADQAYMHRNDNDVQIFGNSPPPSASRFQNPVQSLDWNGGME